MDTTVAKRQHVNITLAVLALSGAAFSLLQSLVLPALPSIQEALHTSESTVSWVLTAYLLSASVATPIVGRLGDMFGKEKMLLIALLVLCFGTLLAAIASSISMLILARLVQGVGGGIFPLAFGIIRDEFPRERVAGGIGFISAILGIGGGLGVVLAGVIVDHLSYHYLFWFPLIGIVIATVLTFFFIPESPIKTPGRINWLAAVLMSLGIAGSLTAVSRGAHWGWGSPKTIGLLLAGIVLILAWIRVELRSDEPLVDMKMMEIKGVWTTNVVAFLLGAGMFSLFLLIPQLVQLPTSTGFGFGASVTGAGLYLLPSTMLMLFVGSFAGKLEGRFGLKPPLIAGVVFAAASFLLLIISHSAKIDIYLATSLLGIGLGLAYAALPNLIVQNVPPEQTGVATGMNAVMRSLGGAVGGQIVATLLSANLRADGYPAESQFLLSFIFALVALGAATAIAVLIPSARKAPAASAVPVADAA